jgi:hypothetical protein
MLGKSQIHGAAERIRQLEKCSDLIRARNRDLPAYNITSQPLTLPPWPRYVSVEKEKVYKRWSQQYETARQCH